MIGSLRGDPSCTPPTKPAPEAVAVEVEEEPTPETAEESKPRQPMPEPPQFDRTKIVPMHRPFMETDWHDTETNDKEGE
jgi:hypothetical protein